MGLVATLLYSVGIVLGMILLGGAERDYQRDIIRAPYKSRVKPPPPQAAVFWPVVLVGWLVLKGMRE